MHEQGSWPYKGSILEDLLKLGPCHCLETGRRLLAFHLEHGEDEAHSVVLLIELHSSVISVGLVSALAEGN